MDPSLILILLFIVAPLIEKLLKAGKNEPDDQPPRPRAPRDLPGQAPRPTPRVELPRERVEPRQRAPENAADILPNDLWEILTGQKPAPAPRRVPMPEPEPEPEEVGGFEIVTEDGGSWDDDVATEEIGASADVRSVETATAREIPVLYERPIVERELPKVVSMEALTIDPKKRHDEFHRKVDRLAARDAAAERSPRTALFASTDEVRRGIIVAEVLGPPKGLQP